MRDDSHDSGELPRPAQGLPVAGYQPQSEERVITVNAFKTLEEHLLRILDTMQGDADFDQRWLAMARSSFEVGFMQINRSAFRPARLTDEQLAASQGAAEELVARVKAGVTRSA